MEALELDGAVALVTERAANLRSRLRGDKPPGDAAS
jgi:hypothetical protein